MMRRGLKKRKKPSSLLLLGVGFLACFFFSPAFSVSAHGTYTFAVYPTNDPGKVHAAFRPLADFIAAETGWTLRVVVTRNYQEMEQRLQDGSVDFAMVSPAAYVRFVSRVCYVATYAEWSEITQALSPYYHSVTISLKESPIETLQDLKGKNFGFTDRESTSGHRVPRRMLLKEGMEPEKFFKKVFYLGRHDAVIESLLAGSIQGGAVSDGTLHTAVSQYGDLFRILALSDPIPLDPVVASTSVPKEDVALLQKVLLSLPTDSRAMETIREILGWPGAGFVLLDTHFYDSLREALEIEIPKEDHDI